jgi:hypothetical protein
LRLRTVPASLALITNSDGIVGADPLAGAPASLHLYTILATGASFSAGALAPGKTASASALGSDSALYSVSTAAGSPSPASLSSTTPARLHILGVAWLDGGQVLGFSPVSAWVSNASQQLLGDLIPMLGSSR